MFNRANPIPVQTSKTTFNTDQPLCKMGLGKIIFKNFKKFQNFKKFKKFKIYKSGKSGKHG